MPTNERKDFVKILSIGALVAASINLAFSLISLILYIIK